MGLKRHGKLLFVQFLFHLSNRYFFQPQTLYPFLLAYRPICYKGIIVKLCKRMKGQKAIKTTVNYLINWRWMRRRGSSGCYHDRRRTRGRRIAARCVWAWIRICRNVKRGIGARSREVKLMFWWGHTAQMASTIASLSSMGIRKPKSS